MYKNNFYRLLIAFLILIGSSHVQAVVQNDKAKWKHLDKTLLDNTTLTALERWHTDSLGCLNLRTTDDSDFLIETFGLDNTSSDSVIAVMGKPNHIFRGEYVTQEYDEINAVIYDYYFHTRCNGDSLQSEAFITFIISAQTNRVIERAGGIH